MAFTTAQNARAVLLPAFGGVELSDAVKRLLDTGGVSILLGENRDEYVARSVSADRRASENRETFTRVTSEAKARAGMLLTAVDQELGGICRLHDLVTQFPGKQAIARASAVEIEAVSRQVAEQARGLGVNVFLSPVLDVLTGPNPWLSGRTFSSDPSVVAKLSAAYIRGVQQGGVAATGKHFPGFTAISGDPAVEDFALNALPLADVERVQEPFHAAIAAGVEMIMVGPAIVTAYDTAKPALRSRTIIDRLKGQFGFKGTVMADDLDGKATMLGDSVPAVAIDALNAGCDFLLLADIDDQLDVVAGAIEDAARSGAISETALAASADRVRRIAAKYPADL
jgi:beta-N-acetylhexosaminidase